MDTCFDFLKSGTFFLKMHFYTFLFESWNLNPESWILNPKSQAKQYLISVSSTSSAKELFQCPVASSAWLSECLSAWRARILWVLRCLKCLLNTQVPLDRPNGTIFWIFLSKQIMVSGWYEVVRVGSIYLLKPWM